MEPRSPLIPPDLLIEETRWRGAVRDPERVVRRAFAAVIRCGETSFNPGFGHGPAPTVILSDDRRVKRLNARYRGRNKATNVLTFDPLSPHHGGDIVLAFETIRREALAAKRPVRAHLAHMVVHGLLHLCGFDHHHAGEARLMETVEARILRASGFANPWKQGGRVRS